jgi:hypothetical protein
MQLHYSSAARGSAPWIRAPAANLTSASLPNLTAAFRGVRLFGRVAPCLPSVVTLVVVAATLGSDIATSTYARTGWGAAGGSGRGVKPTARIGRGGWRHCHDRDSAMLDCRSDARVGKEDRRFVLAHVPAARDCAEVQPLLQPVRLPGVTSQATLTPYIMLKLWPTLRQPHSSPVLRGVGTLSSSWRSTWSRSRIFRGLRRLRRSSKRQLQHRRLVWTDSRKNAKGDRENEVK